ncbi:hypothetical protein PIB30_016417 [Stylosanthes scabra]|uniref:Uncharacterized protein n=1 Tax=Stylosanthes scabra TaxID=79078 RepID=A0ABU6V697_9FABA|nr:hypothetical protein [Stylosanthes scabra]
MEVLGSSNLEAFDDPPKFGMGNGAISYITRKSHYKATKMITQNTTARCTVVLRKIGIITIKFHNSDRRSLPLNQTIMVGMVTLWKAIPNNFSKVAVSQHMNNGLIFSLLRSGNPNPICGYPTLSNPFGLGCQPYPRRSGLSAE